MRVGGRAPFMFWGQALQRIMRLDVDRNAFDLCLKDECVHSDACVLVEDIQAILSGSRELDDPFRYGVRCS